MRLWVDINGVRKKKASIEGKIHVFDYKYQPFYWKNVENFIFVY